MHFFPLFLHIQVETKGKIENYVSSYVLLLHKGSQKIISLQEKSEGSAILISSACDRRFND